MHAADCLNALIVLHGVANPFLYGAFAEMYDYDMLDGDDHVPGAFPIM